MSSSPLPPRRSGFWRAAYAAIIFALPPPLLAEPQPEQSFWSFLKFERNVDRPSEGQAADAPLPVHELAPASPLPDTIDLTTPADDLWQRLRIGFSMPNLHSELVLYHQQWYQNRPELLRRIAERSRRYMHHIVEELEKRGMPTELALLPMVESAYNPMALSPAQASGLWQFIPSTGKTYRLEQNWWMDQRRDIVASTSAALDYLQYIYEMHGDWHLALASYNWGEGAVKRAIEKNAARGLPTDYLSLNMPNETKHYVPKLQALKNIFGNPRLVAELNLPLLPNRPYFATIENSKPMDVKTAAKLADMPIKEFVALNPAHNRPMIKPDVPLVIPADKVETFQSNLESHEEPLSSWQTYTLKPGDKLDKLAPRFGISLDDLKRVNGVNGKLKIAAGSTLLVPAAKGEADMDYVPVPPRLPNLAIQPADKKHPAPVANEKSGKPGKVDKASKPSPASGTAKTSAKATKTASVTTKPAAPKKIAGASKAAPAAKAPPAKSKPAPQPAKPAKKT